MITMDRHYRSFDFNMVDNQQMIVQGMPVVFDTDTVLYEYDGLQYKERIDRNAFNGADLTDVVLNIDHEGKPAAKTRNGTLKLEVRNDGVYMTADLSKNETGRELFEDISNGFYDKMSFAFTVAEDSYNTDTRTRTILKIKKCYDVSAVTFAAYDKTSISARSWAEAEAEAERKASEEAELRRKLIISTYF